MAAATARRVDDETAEDEYALRVAAAAPPFTAQQRERIAAALGRTPQRRSGPDRDAPRPGR